MKGFKIYKILLTFIPVLFLITCFPQSASSQFFTINRFHSEIRIYKDSSISVKEIIEVKFQQLRRGIYRDIPFKYKDDFGNTVLTPIKILSITDKNGNPLKYKVTKTGHILRIRIGDEKKYIKGFVTYIINYRIKNAILFFQDHDELYWNVTGNDWKAPIEDASAEVFLLTENKSKEIMISGFEGIYGSKEECGYEASENIGRFRTRRRLAPGEGLTIVFGWDKGLVFPPSSLKKFLWVINLEENWIFLIPLVSIFYMLNLWYRKGRDPKVRESITVIYEPPKFNQRNLTPAEIGTILDERIDPRDIISTILDLAVRGYIRIEEIKKEGLLFEKVEFLLRKVKELDNNLNSFEKELMKTLFPQGLTEIYVSDLKNRFYKNLNLLKRMLYEELVKKRYFFKNPENVRNFYMILSFIIFIFTIIILGVVFPYLGMKAFLSGLLTAIPVFFLGRVMPAKTKKGASVYMNILGFREFMSRAEKDRIERMSDENLFSKLLPYAISLDVVDNWVKAFEDIYQNPPDWYTSSASIGRFNLYIFSRSIQLMSTNLTQAIFSSPRGSGFRGSIGGGGFSGGGFGGGGGGSW